MLASFNTDVTTYRMTLRLPRLRSLQRYVAARDRACATCIGTWANIQISPAKALRKWRASERPAVEREGAWMRKFPSGRR